MKLKITILNRLIKKLNDKEINLLIYLAQRQDEATGIVRDVYYKDAIQFTEMSQSHFYNILISLEKKDFIIVDYSNSKYYTIRIIGNSFPNLKNNSKPKFKDEDAYLNLNYSFLHTAQFMKLDRYMKKFVLRIFSLKSRKQELDFTEDKLKEYKVLDRLEELKMYLSVKFYNNKYYFRIISEYTKKEKFELNTYLDHKLRALCNKFNIKFNRQEFNDTLEVYAYYYTKNDNDKLSNLYLSRIMKGFDIFIKIGRLVPAMFRNVCSYGNSRGDTYLEDKVIKHINNMNYDIDMI